MPFPLAPVLGGTFVAEAAKRAAAMAAAALGSSKGAAPDNEEGEDADNGGQSSSGVLGRLLGVPLFDPEAAKTAVIQGAVVTALVVLFFVGLIMFVGRSVKVR